MAAAKLYTAALLDLFFTALLHIFCSALLDKFCSAPHACATTIHSFGPGDTGTNMEANSGEICTCEESRGQFWGHKGQNGRHRVRLWLFEVYTYLLEFVKTCIFS